MGVGGLSRVPFNQSWWVTLPCPPSWAGQSKEREEARCKGFIYFRLLGVSLRALDRGLEGFIPLLDLVNGCLAGLRGHGKWLGGGREGALICPSTVSRHCWKPAGCQVLGSKHTPADSREEKLLAPDDRCEK